MNPTMQRVFAYCGVAFAVVFFLGMLLAGLLPPHLPAAGPDQVATLWYDHPERHELGLFLCIIAGGLSGPFAAIISVYLRRIDPTHACSNLQLIGGATGVVAVLVPIFMFTAAAYRPEGRPNEVLQAINDLAWLPFIGNFPPALMQTLAIACAVFGQRDGAPEIFPRWVGYYNLWTAILFLPGGLVIFFHSGPFAWNGIFAFWLAAVVFGAWFIVMAAVLVKTINATATADPADGSLAPDHAGRPPRR
ncbi:MAG TPA: hypothetical protein VGH89_09840 [Pseudonocardia sp.]|jgi:hypothetical protein